MAGRFQPKRVKVPGLLSDDGLAAALKTYTQGGQDVAQSQVPTSAVEFADKVVQLGQQSPGPKLKPLPSQARSIAKAADNVSEAQRSDKIGNSLAGAVSGGLQAVPVLGPALQSISTLGTISDPAEQQREKQRQIDAANADEQAIKTEAAEAERLRALTDDEFFAETGINPNARSLGGTPEAAAQSDVAAQLDAQEATKTAKEGPLPTQTWWLNAAQVAARSAAQMGVSALKAPVDVWEMTGGYVTSGGDIENSEVGVWLDGVDKAVTKMLPGDPSRSKEFLTKLSAGAGSMAGFMIAGYAGRAIGIPAGWASGVLGGATEANQLYEEAEDFGAVGMQKYFAFIMGAGLGASEALPIDRAFMRADAATGGMVRKLLQNTQATSLAEFLQEYGQTMGEDLVAKYGAGYDPERKLDPGSWLEAGVIGAITGAVAGGTTTVINELAPQPVEKVDDAKVVQAVDAALAAGEQRFNEIYAGEEAEAAVREPSAEGEVPAAPGADAARTQTAVPALDPVRGDEVQQMVAYHGTPHKVDKFSSEKIGTGEGAQAFGHGLYFAGNREVAEHYKKALTRSADNWSVNGRKLSDLFSSSEPESNVLYEVGIAARGGRTIEQSLDFVETQIKGRLTSKRVQPEDIPVYQEQLAQIEELRKNPPQVEGNKGGLYTVDIPSDEELLDWDAPLSEQPQAVQDVLAEIAPDQWSPEGADYDANETGQMAYDRLSAMKGWSPAEASKALRDAGVPGIRYLDGGSRKRGEGNRNYVIFDDERISILDVEQSVGRPLTREQNIDPVQLDPADLSPLPNLEKGLHGPIPIVVKAAKAYAQAAGIPHRRQSSYVRVDVARASRVAEAYANMKHEPQDPAVAQSYAAMAEETLAQYQFLKATGLKVEAIKEGQDDPYPSGPRDVLVDINKGHIWYFPTKFGFGSDATFDPATNPLLEETSEVSDNGEPMLVNDVFRVVHDFFGHGLEGSGFGARGEENAWQSHMRLYSAEAVPAMTSETRGQNSWVNYGPKGEWNRTHPRETIYADQKTGFMPSWTWEEGLADQGDGQVEQSVVRTDPLPLWPTLREQGFDRWFRGSVVKKKNGHPMVVYHGTPGPGFTVFDPARTGVTSVLFSAIETHREGFFFAESREFSKTFADQARGKGGTVIPVYLSIKDPFEGDAVSAKGQAAAYAVADKIAEIDPSYNVDFFLQRVGSDDFWEVLDTPESGDVVRQAMQALGYDGIRMVEPNHDTRESEVTWVAFDQTQIKSAERNSGAYNPTDPDIERSTGTATARQPYKLEPTRPTKGIPLPKDTRTDTALADVRLTQISKQFIKALDLTARQGRLAAKNRNVMGEYHRNNAAIRLRTWTDFATLVHEGGHALNDMHSQPMDDFTDRHRGELSKIAFSLYGGDLSKAPIETVLREGFAEFFRVYAMTPAYARNRWGALTADFENTLDAADPKLRSSLEVTAQQFGAWLQLPSSQLVENMVIDGRRLQGVNAAIKEIKDAGFHSWFQEYSRRAVTWSINRYAPLNQFVTDLLNQGEENRGVPLDLKRSDDPRVIMRLARNSGSRAQVEMVDGIVGYRSTQSGSRGLREALLTALDLPPDTTPSSLDPVILKSFDAYLVSRRALDEWRRYEAGEIDRPPTGAQKGDHVRHARETEKAYPTFAKAAEIVHEYGMALWHKRYEAGLMSKETYDEGLQRQFYAPLQRDVSDKQGDGKQGLSFGASALTQGPRFKGSDRDIVSPMTVLMQMTFAVERQIAENDAKKALAILADRAGKAGALVERIPASQLIGQSFSVEQVARQLTADADLSVTDAADLMSLLEGSVEQGDVMTLYRSEQAGAQGENVLFFWENGKVSAIRLTEKSLGADVVNLMNGLGRENMDFTMELLAGTSGVFRTAITKWPDFLIVNYIRDQMSAWVLSDVGFIPFVSGIKGMAEEIRQKQWAKSYNVAAGVMGGMNSAAMHKARVDRDINSLRAKGYKAQLFGEMDGTFGGNVLGAIKGFSRFTELSETGTRLGLYQKAFERAKRDGLNDYEASQEAAYIATDYIDFGLNGSKMLTTRRIIPFLNAQLQGLYKMVRTLGGDEVAQRKGLKFVLTAYFKSVKNLPLSRVEKQQLNAGRLAWVKMASLGLFSALLAMLFKDDPDYQEAGEYLRVTGWVLPLGDGKVFWLPKPFELAIVANAVERGIEFASGDSEAPGRFLRGAVQSLVPPTSPPALQTLTELSVNKDFFTGRDIVPDYMQALSPELQYDNYTSSLAKWMGQTFGWSPMVVDHALSGLGASAYRDTMTVFNLADPNRPLPDITDAPLTRRFVRDVRRGSASAQDFWAQASTTSGALERAATTYKRYTDAGNEIAANRFLATLSSDARAYAVLNTDFKVEAKRLNPFYRARQVTTIISKMRRELTSAESVDDTTLKDVPAAIALSPGLKTQLDDILSEIARREVRNTLIATGQPGWKSGKERLPLDSTLDMLLAVSPEVYDEYQRRYVKAKVYDAETVYEGWPEVRDRLNSDGSFAVLTDMIALAGAGL